LAEDEDPLEDDVTQHTDDEARAEAEGCDS
jgi:hypothetical protein